MAKQFQEGDKVRLKSGGPAMVVDSATRFLATCLVVSDGVLKQKVYPQADLMAAEDIEPCGSVVSRRLDPA